MIETDKTFFIDCRPSDALALVVRTGTPIFVDEEILNEVGIMPEDIMVYDQDEPMEDLDEPGNLSVFEDFLDNLQKDDDQDDSPDSEPPTNPDPFSDLPF